MSMGSVPELLPPATHVGVIGWLKINLFNSPIQSALTVVTLTLAGWLVLSVGRWAIFNADWSPITQSLKLFWVGPYPSEELWRIGAAVVGAAVLMGASWAVWGGVLRTFAVILAATGVAVAVTPFVPTGLDLAVRVWYLGVAIAVVAGLQGARALSAQPGWVIRAWVLLFFVGLLLVGGVDERSLGSSVGSFLRWGIGLTLVLGGGGWAARYPREFLLKWLAVGWGVLAFVTFALFWGVGQT